MFAIVWGVETGARIPHNEARIRYERTAYVRATSVPTRMRGDFRARQYYVFIISNITSGIRKPFYLISKYDYIISNRTSGILKRTI